MAEPIGHRGSGACSPTLTIIFINRNTTRLLRNALSSLERNPPEFPLEVIIADNASTDGVGLPLAGARFPIRTVEIRRNLGYGAAANLCLNLVRGEFVAIANPDLLFLPGTLERLVGFLRADASAGIVAPQFLWPDLTPQPSARRAPRLDYVLAGRRSPLNLPFTNRNKTREFLYAGIETQTAPVRVEVVIGAFFIARRSLLLELHGFDETYFMFAEDVDLCRRVARSGRGVFILPTARIVHLGGRARETEDAWVDFVRLRSFHTYFRRELSARMNSLLFLLFGAYLAVLLAARTLGLREREYRVEA